MHSAPPRNPDNNKTNCTLGSQDETTLTVSAQTSCFSLQYNADRHNAIETAIDTVTGSDLSLTPLSASSDKHEQTGKVQVESIGGEWSLTRETLPDDPDWMILKFKCRDELVPDFEGRQVEVVLGDRSFDLGQISRRGIAEVEIPSGLDLSESIDVRIHKRPQTDQ